MGRMGFAALSVLVAAFACVHEAASSAMTLISTEEIMNRTTVESAVKLVLGLNGTHPELATLLQKKFGHAAGINANNAGASAKLRSVKRHSEDPVGYAAVEGAVNMLADMMSQSMATFDEVETSCHMFDVSQFDLMHNSKDAIAFFNSEANSALSRMLDANSKIGTFTNELHGMEEQRREVEQQCAEDLETTRRLLAVVTADVRVMATLLNLTQCGDDQDVSMVQTGGEALARSNTSNHALVSCDCDKSKGMVMLHNPKIAPLLNKLQSLFAKKELQKQLRISFRKAAQRGRTPVALSQISVAHQLKLVKGMSSAAIAGARQLRVLHQRVLNETNETDLESAAYSLDVADEPADPVPIDCQPTTKCSLSDANCPLMNERFEAINGGLVEKMEELTHELAELERYCETEQQNLEGQISTLSERLGEEQSKFAGAAGDKDTSEQGSKAKAQEYDNLQHEYNTRSKECCDQLNEARSEQCALRKIREELVKLEGVDLFAVDCEVSEWVEEECTVTCGGGERQSTREILAQPENGGAPCQALVKTEPCNELPCPVACVMSDWGGFGACNKECGGGLRERTRSVLVEAQHYGDPCEERTDAESCNSLACDADCVLEDWTPWSMCSAFCDGGSQRRSRGVAEEARGTGYCAEADAEPERLQFQVCNPGSCESLLPEDRKLVTCVSAVDVIVVLDGSASLGTTGWEKTKEFGEMLIENMMGGDKVHVALQVFSYKHEWVSHFTNDTAAVAAMVKNVKWPRSATYTHTALIAAEKELLYGREEANAVVVVVTDGYPTYAARTKAAAHALMKKARILWVPVGAYAPVEYINELASKPIKEHVVPITDMQEMTDSKMINKVLAHSCPMLE